MSGLSLKEQASFRQAQEEYLARGGEIHRMPSHAVGTGNIRFNFASRAQKEREAAKVAEGLQEVRSGK